MTARALSLLAAFASPVFMAAAVAGWISGSIAATPLTFAIAVLLVIGGPVLGLVHVATSREHEDEAVVIEAPPVPAAVRRLPAPRLELTPRAEAARRFAAWREGPVLQRRA